MTFPSKGDTTLSAWASAYAEYGWPVFPLRPRDKTPLTKNGFQDATVHPDQIAEWWTVWPDANIGLPTGICFDVLDVDGLPAAEALKAHIGHGYFHAGPVAKTGKGWHFLFEVTGRGNGAKLLPDTALDFRGLGGYIVAPPSMHPKGHRYEWTERDYTHAPAPITDWLMPLLRREAKPKRLVLKPFNPDRTEAEEWTLMQAGKVLTDQLPRAIRQRANRPDIFEVWERRQGIPLRDRGSYAVTACPFHEDSTPSFTLYPDDNTFHCYGCGAHGDSFDLDKDEPTHI